MAITYSGTYPALLNLPISGEWVYLNYSQSDRVIQAREGGCFVCTGDTEPPVDDHGIALTPGQSDLVPAGTVAWVRSPGGGIAAVREQGSLMGGQTTVVGP